MANRNFSIKGVATVAALFAALSAAGSLMAAIVS